MSSNIAIKTRGRLVVTVQAKYCANTGRWRLDYPLQLSKFYMLTDFLLRPQRLLNSALILRTRIIRRAHKN